MKIQKKKKRNLKIYIIIIIATLIACGSLYYFMVLKNSGPDKVDSSRSSQSSDNITQEEREAQARDEAQQKKDYINTDSDNNNPPAETDSSDKITMSITQTNTDVIVATNLGYIASGTCEISTPNGYYASADIMYNVSHSTCMGFSIKKDHLVTGSNTIKLTVSYKNTILTKTEDIVIQK